MAPGWKHPWPHRPGAPAHGSRSLLVAGVIAIYGQTLGFDFVVFDDDKYVTGNPTVQRGLSLEGLGWAFANTAVSAWHPLTWFSHMLDAQLFGDWAGGHHATSVLLHALAAVLLFAALRSLTGSTWRSAAAAALFAWHPLRVESVAWVSERKDVLSGVFAMLTLWCYAHYARSRSRAAWLGTFSFARPRPAGEADAGPPPLRAAAAGSSGRSRGASPWARLVLEKLPFFALSALVSLITLFSQRRFLTSIEGVTARAARRERGGRDRHLPGQARLPELARPALSAPESARAGRGAAGPREPSWCRPCCVVAITLAVLRARRPPYLTRVALVPRLLVPTLGFVQVGRQALADRYTYLPGDRSGVALVWGVAELGARVRAPAARRLFCAAAVARARRLRHRRPSPDADLARLGDACFATRSRSARGPARCDSIWAAGCSCSTARTRRSSSTGPALEVAPDNALMHFDLGRALHATGASGGGDRASTSAPRRSSRATPRFWYQLGLSYEREGRLAEAIEHYRRTVELDPANQKPRQRLAAALARQRGR